MGFSLLGFRFGWERGTACKRLVKRISKKKQNFVAFVCERWRELWPVGALLLKRERERESDQNSQREKERRDGEVMSNA